MIEEEEEDEMEGNDIIFLIDKFYILHTYTTIINGMEHGVVAKYHNIWKKMPEYMGCHTTPSRLCLLILVQYLAW